MCVCVCERERERERERGGKLLKFNVPSTALGHVITMGRRKREIGWGGRGGVERRGGGEREIWTGGGEERRRDR